MESPPRGLSSSGRASRPIRGVGRTDMKQSDLRAFDAIAKCHRRLQDVAAALVDSWRPDEVPATVGLGELGHTLVEAGLDVDEEALKNVAARVEEFLIAGGAVGDAVATGFLEAICNLSLEHPSSVRRLVRELGARGRAYVQAWDRFTGCATPEAPRDAGQQADAAGEHSAGNGQRDARS